MREGVEGGNWGERDGVTVGKQDESLVMTDEKHK